MGAGLLDDVLELAELLRPRWDETSAAIPAWHPRCEGDDDAGDGGGDGAGDDAGTGDGDGGSDGDDADDSADDGGGSGSPADTVDYWKRQSRKWEGRAKKNATRAETAETALNERADADKSEQEKAVETAARTAREEARSESEKERRADKLEMAVTKLGAVRGVKVGTGDDERTVKFADPDDVQMWLEKQIERGEVDADAIYADGKVNEDALADELVRLAEAKPGWLVGTSKPNGRPAGSADGGRGAAPSSDTDVEATLQKIQRRRSGAAA